MRASSAQRIERQPTAIAHADDFSVVLMHVLLLPLGATEGSGEVTIDTSVAAKR